LKPSLRRVFVLILLVFAGFFLFSFLRNNIACVGGFPVFKSKKAAMQKPQEEIPLNVKAYKVSKVSFRDTLPALGTVKGFREIDMKFPVNGTIEYINFKEGEKITQGDIIASLDQKEALLKLEYANVELEKQNKLYELGSAVETKLKQVKLEYQSAKVELEKTNLVALSDGYIGSLSVDRGSFVTPQDKVGTFVDMKDVYVEFGVIEKDIAKLKEGQNVEVTVESFPDQVFKGQVDSISPLVEGRSRTLKVRSKITNPDEKLRPGMFGRVNVLVYEKENALVIPSSSFKKKEDQYFVYLIHPEEQAAVSEETALEMGNLPSNGPKNKHGANIPAPQEPKAVYGTVEIRPIEVSYATPDAIEVKSGLEEGDRVAVDVEQELKDKARVEIAETQEGIF